MSEEPGEERVVKPYKHPPLPRNELEYLREKHSAHGDNHAGRGCRGCALLATLARSEARCAEMEGALPLLYEAYLKSQQSGLTDGWWESWRKEAFPLLPEKARTALAPPASKGGGE